MEAGVKEYLVALDGTTAVVDLPDPPQMPLDATAALAALLAATGVLDVTDAANAVGQTPEALVAEVQAWAVAGGNP